jgi:hypothetical protein
MWIIWLILFILVVAGKTLQDKGDSQKKRLEGDKMLSVSKKLGEHVVAERVIRIVLSALEIGA